MKIRNALNYLTGKGGSDRGSEPGPGAGHVCPEEIEILNYIENRVTEDTSAKLERHFAQCDNCRELLVLYVQLRDELAAGNDAAGMPPVTDSEVEQQTAHVLAMIKEDEWRRRQTAADRPQRRSLSGIFVTYTQLGVFAVICAIAISVVYLITKSPAPDTAAMQALASAIEKDRRIEPRISGDFSHSNYSQTRGEERKYEVQFDRALNKLKDAEQESASPKERMALARVYLARNDGKDTEDALKILRGLVDKGERSPELFNDLGVALYVQGKYKEAVIEFNKALEMSPDFDQAIFNKALAETEAGSSEEAMQDWSHFLRVAKDPQWKAEAQGRLSALEKSMNR